MSSQFDSLVERTIGLVQNFLGDIVAGTLEKAKTNLLRNAMTFVVGATGVVLALVFGAIGFHGWLGTIVDANHRWAPAAIVAVVCGVIGIAVLRSARCRGER